jgi:hypothetical protein
MAGDEEHTWLVCLIDQQATDERDWLRRCIAGYIAFGLNHPDAYRLAFAFGDPHAISMICW